MRNRSLGRYFAAMKDTSGKSPVSRLPSEKTRDKQILAFGLRARVFKAAEAVAAARLLGDVEGERIAVDLLCRTVALYQGRNRLPQTQTTTLEKP